MTAPSRGDELIRRYVDSQTSQAELVELENLLTTEPAVANAFAEAMRMEASLQAHFQKQYKIDQVARMLEESAASSPQNSARTEDQTTEAPLSPAADVRALPTASIFVPQRGLPHEPWRPRTSTSTLLPPRFFNSKKWPAVALLLLAAGAVTWYSAFRGNGDQPRVISGSVVISGHEVVTILDGAPFDIAGRESAIIDLPGGSRIKLSPATQAAIHHDDQQTVLQILSGGGLLQVPSNRAVLQVVTQLGTVSTAGSRFSLHLSAPAQISTTEPVSVRQLAIVVHSGSVTVDRGGVMTTLSAGDERVFF
jgi:hypothetical protein